MTDTTTTFPTTAEITADVLRALKATGVDPDAVAGDTEVRTPITGDVIFRVRTSTRDDIDTAVATAAEAFTTWRDIPAPVRGQLVKRWGQLLTEHKEDLGALVTAEVGKVTSEALGEVQEMIDITDLAVGQSRQLYGKTMPSERPGHRLAETWHPLGVVGVISAFNFPVAVYSWNTALALICGNSVVWKPAEATPLTALATDALLARAAEDVGAPAGLHHVVISDRTGGEQLVNDTRVALVSATGSVRMGREIAP
ncbi:MAG: aldehyde dehydrogenase family protein, partial [Microlunatus sp.]|nr:aldehyde dehydrogenase family protein [Microlunatus sp.]